MLEGKAMFPTQASPAVFPCRCGIGVYLGFSNARALPRFLRLLQRGLQPLPSPARRHGNSSRGNGWLEKVAIYFIYYSPLRHNGRIFFFKATKWLDFSVLILLTISLSWSGVL